ncbi:MAG: hypothetical protein V1652_01555 [bacterium]
MLLGHEIVQKRFTELVDTSSLFHGYIFFGDSRVGKFSFAYALAYYIEHGSWDISTRYLNETSIIVPDEKTTIGIEQVRSIKKFLLEKPVYSAYRTVIVDNADCLTAHAQHAFLKIAEEPPLYGLIILVLSNPESLFDTLQSRFHKIYFPRVQQSAIKNFMNKEYRVSLEEADELARISFGCVGQAVQLHTDAAIQKRMSDAISFVTDKYKRNALMNHLANNKEEIEPFLQAVIMYYGSNPVLYYKELRVALKRLHAMIDANTNKRLQMDAFVWNI